MAVSVLPFAFPGIDNVGCLFQMRAPASSSSTQACNPALAGGTIVYTDGIADAEVLANRRALLAASGAAAFCEARQVHGDHMLFDPEPAALERAKLAEADGLATSRAGVALMIKTADCQPVLLAHRSGRYVAGLHVGWRGDRQLFPYTGVRRFCEHYNIRPEDCMAVRGPSLGPTRAEFIHYAAEWGGYFYKYLDLARSTMDLWSMTRDQLREAGIPARHIYGLDWCTASNPDQFFSYRRDHGCGRQAALVWIKEQANG
ncbi:MAG: polyphenol oxidase family protein [Desulfovibrionaceae bacterium]|nr:polyphenol oxidase family protein [Desulfovibrionaceae bacterium]